MNSLWILEDTLLYDTSPQPMSSDMRRMKLGGRDGAAAMSATESSIAGSAEPGRAVSAGTGQVRPCSRPPAAAPSPKINYR